MKNLKAKSFITKLLCLALVLCLAFPSGLFSALPTSPAFADDEDEIVYEEFIETVNISDSQFNVSTTTSPASSSSWTGANIGGSNKSVVSGVISFNKNFTDNYDNLKLDQYPEFSKDKIPYTPFGITVENPQEGTYHEGTNKNVLMINTDGDRAAYGHSSAEITLDAASYYRFSVWVKTGIFDGTSGAAVVLTGLSEPVGIWNIDTSIDLTPDEDGNPILNVANNYGFVEHVIYIGTGYNSESVRLRLSVGDDADGQNWANGYAFFANVGLVKMSPTTFHSQTLNVNSPNFESVVIVYDMNPESSGKVLTSGSMDIGSFNGSPDGRNGWKKLNLDTEFDNNIYFNTHNAGLERVGGEGFGFTSDPYSPDGRYDSINKVFDNNNIMVLSSFDGNDGYNSVSAGIISNGITIEKEKYYRITAWYSTLEGASASVSISGRSTDYASENKLGPFNNTGLTSDQNAARYGWKRTSFYIKGSSYENVEINVELWLGDRTSASAGIAMFDNITFEEISYTDYSENLYAATLVSIDTNSASSNTNVSNGEFKDVIYGEDLDYPLQPESWTYIDTATHGTIGQSVANIPTYYNPSITKDEESKIESLAGVVLGEDNHYNSKKDEFYRGIPNPLSPNSDYDNMLLMATPENHLTAFGYRSSALSISGGSDYKITVSLHTQLDGYGANLILKNGNSIISNIENIHTNALGFKDYSFYVSGAAGEASLTLEIWLGLTDKTDNRSKLASGYMFVDSVKMDTIDSSETTQKLDEYNNSPSVQNLNFAVYRLGAFDLNAYDRFSTDDIKQLYDMSITADPTTQYKAGVITSGVSSQSTIPEYFFELHNKTNDRFANNNALYLENTNEGYTRFEADNTFALTAGMCYKIEFSMLVVLSAESAPSAVGAGIWLNDESISDIRNTYKTPALIYNGQKIDELEFTTFTFYYAVGADNESVKWAITLGSDDAPNKAISGRVFLNNIVVTEIDGEVFTNMEDDYNDNKDHKTAIINNSVAPADDTPADETPDENGNTGCGAEVWTGIVSIMFVVAILVALVVVFYRKFKAKRKPVDKNEKVVSYDRNETISTNARKSADTAEVIAASDAIYEDFNEDSTPTPADTTTTTTATTLESDSTSDEAIKDETVDPIDSTPAPENEFDD